ncbi:hypothetical protein ACL07V_28505 [Streptomyces sp. MB22_4]|uniref:hypothetical protein n=1 Tax=Streptomyces sp. MB22_4 TaxID=3383120 RepID=UPI00399FA95D
MLEALRYGRAHGMVTVGLPGPDGGLAREPCDAYVLAPADSIEEQEDIHVSLAHILTRHMRAFVHASHPEPTGATTAQVR